MHEHKSFQPPKWTFGLTVAGLIFFPAALDAALKNSGLNVIHYKDPLDHSEKNIVTTTKHFRISGNAIAHEIKPSWLVNDQSPVSDQRASATFLVLQQALVSRDVYHMIAPPRVKLNTPYRNPYLRGNGGDTRSIQSMVRMIGRDRVAVS